jgi:N-acetylmuramoyl-L-alanine amidase
VTDLEAWEYVAEKLQSTLARRDAPKHAAKALFLLGELNEKTWRKRGYLLGLSRAVDSYKRLVTGYPKNRLADDALVRLGDLYLNGFADRPSARKMYQRVVDDYDSGDMVADAWRRLRNLSGNKSAAEENTAAPLPAPKAEPRAAVVMAASGNLKSSKRFVSRWRRLSEPGLSVALTTSAGGDQPLVVIDPGHGGEELGAVGVDGLLEKDIVLGISRKLETLLQERIQARTVLTREEDRDIPLIERSGRANALNANLFVSIHANASIRHQARGIETYYLDNTRDRASLRLASFENEALRGFDDDDLSFMLSDMIQSAKQPDSIALAHHVQSALVDVLSGEYQDIRSLGVKRGPFHVLVGAHMPCILVEVSFIDHPVEGKRLADPNYQQLIAEGLFEGIQRFFVRKTEENIQAGLSRRRR